MVTIMSIGSKNFAPNPSANESQAMIQRQAIAAGVDLSFAVVSVLVFIGLIIALLLSELIPAVFSGIINNETENILNAYTIMRYVYDVSAFRKHNITFLKADTSYTYLIIVYALRMFSVSLLMMPLNTAGINSLSNKNISHGTAISNFGRVTAL